MRLPELCRRVKCVDDFGRNPTAGGHLVATAAGPFPNCGTLLAINRRPPPTWAARTTTTTTTHAPSGVNPLFQILAEFLGILRREVNLITHAVDREFHCLIGRSVAIEIIDKGDSDFLSHDFRVLSV